MLCAENERLSFAYLHKETEMDSVKKEVENVKSENERLKRDVFENK